MLEASGDQLSVIAHPCVSFLVPEKRVCGVLVVWAMGSSGTRPLLCLLSNIGQPSLQNINNSRWPC